MPLTAGKGGNSRARSIPVSYTHLKTEIFNPWSVINYFHNECEPRAFWQSTGSNDIISEIIAQADNEIYDRLDVYKRQR